MARFAQKHTGSFETRSSDEYEHGYSYPIDSYTHISKPGLSEQVIQEISHLKGEPEWMLKNRLVALKQFMAKKMPAWGADLSGINFDKIHYYLRPTDKQAKSWDDVPADVKATFDRLGIPEAERDVLAGVKAQYDCLTGDAKVFLKSGIKEIKDVLPGDIVWSLNEVTGLLEEQKVVALASKGIKKIYQVTTQGGRKIKVTENHPFLHLEHTVKVGKKRGRYKKVWKYLSDLKVDDLIALTVDIPDKGKPYELPPISNPKKIIGSKNQFKKHALDITNWYAKISFPKKSSEELLWLLGFYIGDGCMGGRNKDGVYTRIELAIPESEPQLREEVAKIAKDLFNYDLLIGRRDRVILNSILFVLFFQELGLSGSAHTKRIPNWVFSLPRSQKLAFWGGYFDADGSIRDSEKNKDLVVTSASETLLSDFHALAISCGLNVSHIWSFSSKQKYKNNDVLRKGFRLSISGDTSSVKSRMVRKLERFKQRKFVHKFTTAKGTVFRKHTTEHIGFAKILKIEEVGEESVFDIEVEGYHNFIANGLVVHNSEVVYGSLKEVFAKDGVIFLSMDDGLREYPDLVREHFGKVIPSGDNKFSALNTAAWSGGSFVYVPKGVHVRMPLQTYFRINAENAGQFERTLIIVDEGASVHYIEGCFIAGTPILTEQGIVAIEDIATTDKVLTHKGRFKQVGHTQVRPYSGKVFTVTVTGQPAEKITATEEHPFLVVKRQRLQERNTDWDPQWTPIKDVKKGDYVAIPIDQTLDVQPERTTTIPMGKGRHGWFGEELTFKCTPELFRLIGYYLAEGSISAGSYLNFSFSEDEREYIDDVKQLITTVFGISNYSEAHHLKNHGSTVVVRSTKLSRFFEQFGTHSTQKRVTTWVLHESHENQKQLLKGWYRGDGNYYRASNVQGFKEMFRISTTSATLASQGRVILARLGIAASLNVRDRSKEKRHTMHDLVIGGEYMVPFGAIVQQPIQPEMWNKKRATSYYIDKKYLYAPIKSLEEKQVESMPVYNFSVTDDESYVAGGVAVHNCTAPNFSSGSLHSAVVEIVVKKGARCQYTTIQNWYKNVYNLVTKRAHVEEEGSMIWTDFNMGSKITMKYPSFILAGKGAKGETLSMALAAAGQHQDTGSKAIHLAPHTSSTIISKSISKDGGRTSYRGMVNVGPHAYNSHNTVICDALLLDGDSRSDTYPVDRIFNSQVEVQHEATVSKIGDDQLFYLMSRGISEEDARKMIVHGFIDGLVKKLPLEYAVEMNRLIDHEMEGSIG